MNASTAPHFQRSALVSIDVQRDLLDGAPHEISGTSAALPAMRRVVEAFRNAGRPIVHIVRLYLADGSNAELCRRDVLKAGASMLVSATEGAELATELLPSPSLRLDASLLLSGGVQSVTADEVIMFKPRWGAFYRTPLEQHLRSLDVDTIVFIGCNFPNCPRTSIYEASERDFRVVCVEDAVSGMYEKGQRELDNIGVICMSAQSVADCVTSHR